MNHLARLGCGVIALVSLLAAGTSAATAQEGVDTTAIVIMDADGENLRTLYRKPGHLGGTPSISPDGKLLLFDDRATLTYGQTRIYTMPVAVAAGKDAAARDTEADDFPIPADPAAATDLGLGYAPVWSPDSKQIAFYHQANNPDGQTPGVWTMNADGSNRRWRCEGKAPRWSPDGKRLAIVVDGHSGDSIIYYDFDAQLTQRALDRDYPNIAGAAWSPDGKRLAILIPSRAGNGQLLLAAVPERTPADADAPPPATATVRFAGDIGWRPDWSSDGKYLLFWIRDAKQHRRLQRLEVDGTSAPELLKHQEEYIFNSDATWSPDSKQVLWIRTKETAQ